MPPSKVGQVIIEGKSPGLFRGVSARTRGGPRLWSVLFASLGWFLFSSCKSACPGVMIDGKCEKTCQDSACASGTFCVDNACRPKCTTKSDCGLQQTCTARTSDNGVHGSFCVGPSSREVVGAQVGGACTSNSDCDESSGVRCIDRTCTFTCEFHGDCVSCNAQGRCTSIGACTGTATDAAGNAVRTCETDSFPRDAGQFGSLCPNGPMSDDCDAANGFTCAGTEGSIDAYCTKKDCSGDSDCPTGFFCATVRTGGLSSPKSNMCLLRAFCAPCNGDADCLGVRNQLCAADLSGEKICTVLCDDNINSCPWGAATTCRQTDDAVGKPTCSHRFGSCHGTGKSCEPCLDERDCPNGVCDMESFTDEHFCVDLGVSCSCSSGAGSKCIGGGCPVSPPPASSPMYCFQGASAGHCIGAATGPGCWPPH